MSDAEQRGGARREDVAAPTGGRSDERPGAQSDTPSTTPARAGADERSTDRAAPEPAADERGRGAARSAGGDRPATGYAARGGRPAPPTGGRLLAGRYRLGDVLGRGGMGTVWRAEDETLGRTVAVKELRFPNSIDEEEKRRLITRTLREAKAIARIRNNSAVTVFDVVDEDDRPWIVMELVEGKSLAEAIREDGLLEPRRAAEVGLAVLDVLRAAHREGILHRDVKPSNVLIADDGRVVLTDFGIAQVEGDPSITSTGMLVGAPSYISPERARGHRPGPAADLWSLGGLIYASVEGVPPYDKGSAIATLTAVMTEPVDPPQNAGPLEEVIYGLLEKDPAQRLDDAGARALLTAVLSAPDAPAEPPADPTVLIAMPVVTPEALAQRTPERRKRSLRKAQGAGAAALAAGGAVAARPAGPPPVPSAPPSPPAAPPRGPAAGGAYGPLPGATGTGFAPARPGATGGPTAPGEAVASRSAPGASLTDVVPRRTLLVIAAVVALAVIAGVVALSLRDDDPGTESKGSDKVAASGAAEGADTGAKTPAEGAGGKQPDAGERGADPGEGTAPGGGPDGAATGEKGDGKADEGAADAKEDGKADPGRGAGTGAAATHRHDQGFSVGLPEGWKFASNGLGGARYTGPNGQRLLVGWTATPKDDAVADWRNQERAMRRAQYERIRIAAVDYRGWEAADWEFTYVEGGTTYRVNNRGFVVNSRQGYALMYTAKAADWSGEERKRTWRTFTETFRPKP
ncbi:protein kinase domain-containing protein [Streptomyces sp. LE64]|uniref:protein kinase domain-containing protein n=1 Tax=Streptomyces sp. LE64 TaxID=3448653 RepID=UPI0040428D9F